MEIEPSSSTIRPITVNAHPSHPLASLTKHNHDNRADENDCNPPLPSLETSSSAFSAGCSSESGKPLSTFCCSPTLPIWKFYSMAAGKGLCSKRVEDVRMNRIDKLKASRRRRASRRPFVFKSSPLAEGQGAGRLTQFYANSPAHSSPSECRSFISCHTTQTKKLHHTNLYSRCDTASISRFSDLASPSSQWLTNQAKPHSFSTTNRTQNIFSSPLKQPLISRLCNSKTDQTHSASVQKPSDYQSWEISLPKCSIPKMGMLSC